MPGPPRAAAAAVERGVQLRGGQVWKLVCARVCDVLLLGVRAWMLVLAVLVVCAWSCRQRALPMHTAPTWHCTQVAELAPPPEPPPLVPSGCPPASLTSWMRSSHSTRCVFGPSSNDERSLHHLDTRSCTLCCNSHVTDLPRSTPPQRHMSPSSACASPPINPPRKPSCRSPMRSLLPAHLPGFLCLPDPGSSSTLAPCSWSCLHDTRMHSLLSASILPA